MQQHPKHHPNHARSGSGSGVPIVGTPPAQAPHPVPPRQRQKSSIVTFTRPDRSSRDGSEGNVGSYKTAYGSPSDAQQRRSSFSDRPPRSFGRSAPASTTTGFGPRSEVVPFIRQKGFQTATGSSQRPLERPEEKRDRQEGALSRELSHDRLQQTSAASQSLKVRLSIARAVAAFAAPRGLPPSRGMDGDW